MVWNVFGDPDRADPFHEATAVLLNGPSSPSRDDLPFALDKDARVAALERTGVPDRVQADLMGHKFNREKYGKGSTLEKKLEWMQKIQIKENGVCKTLN